MSALASSGRAYVSRDPCSPLTKTGQLTQGLVLAFGSRCAIEDEREHRMLEELAEGKTFEGGKPRGQN